MAPIQLRDPNDKRVRIWLMSGCQFGRWTVLHSGTPDEAGRDCWVCRCSCGTERNVRGKELRGGKTLSCGCYRAERVAEALTIHSVQNTKLYNTWRKMVRRCTDTKDNGYPQYGLRGITVCDRWQNGEGNLTGLDCFYADMGLPPDRSYTLDRIDNSKGYCKENCRWATRIQQNSNRRSVIRLTHNGVTYTLAGWARLTGIPYNLIYRRYRKNLPVESILAS